MSYTVRMGTTIAIIGIGLMVQSVLPIPHMPLIGFIVFAVGAVMALFRI